MDLDGLIVNMPKNYALSRKKMFGVVKSYKLKATAGACGHYFVSFQDVYKEFIKRAFEFANLGKFKVNSKKVKDKLKLGWKKNDEKEAKEEMILKHLAVTTIQRKFLRKVEDKKAARLAKEMEIEQSN